jgi:hypothetical protein
MDGIFQSDLALIDKVIHTIQSKRFIVNAATGNQKARTVEPA